MTREEHQLPPARDLSARRSEDAFRQRQQQFSLAMRAASWGEVGEYARMPGDEEQDRGSLYSGGDRGEEPLDADVLLVGAGGVAQSPVPSVPSGVLSTVSSTVSLGPPVLSAAQALLQRVEAVETPPSVSDPAVQDPNVIRQYHRLHAMSPLAQSLRGSEDEESEEDGQPGMSELYREDDEESESEENAPLEVRTRRPSWGTQERPESPPRRTDMSRERPTIRI